MPDPTPPEDNVSLTTPMITLAEEGDATVANLHGDLDVVGSPRVREELTNIVEEGVTNLVVDFSGVEFVDSTGLGALLNVLKSVNARGGTMLIRNTNAKTRRLLMMSSLDQVFTVEDGPEGA